MSMVIDSVEIPGTISDSCVVVCVCIFVESRYGIAGNVPAIEISATAAHAIIAASIAFIVFINLSFRNH